MEQYNTVINDVFFLIRITLTWYDKKMFEQKLLVTYKDITNKIEGLIINILSKTIQILLIQIFIWFISLNTNANMNIPKSSSTGY